MTKKTELKDKFKMGLSLNMLQNFNKDHKCPDILKNMISNDS